MLVSLSWLKQYVSIDADPQQVAAALTMAGLEVEGIFDRYQYLDTVVVGEIISAQKMEGADNLKVCQVDVGDKSLTVVCGAPNAKAGLKIPVALAGTTLPDGSTVSAGKVRGVESAAMLCSSAELDLGPDASEIMTLSGNPKTGTKIVHALDLLDTVFELGITPNRPDCLSMLGVAREISAIYGVDVRYPDIDLKEDGEPVDNLTAVEIKDPEHCPRYAARMLTGIKVGPSPAWLADRLLSVRVRPINNIVDITNYVMMETGQPLHAFDFDLLEQGRIVVRTADSGEKFTTLDGREIELEPDMLMICDGKKPVALAGVMGGENSEIGPDTRNILIESAHFDPISIRKTAKRLSYHTEASHRFERGTDHDGAIFAATRAARLMLEVAGGVVAKGVLDAHPVALSQKKITLSAKRTNIILGTKISADDIAKYLESVGMETSRIDDDAMTVLPPSYRVDVARPEDLVEEVARLYGYDNIPTTWPSTSMETRAPAPLREFVRNLRELLCGMGLTEAITYSFMSVDSPDLLDLDKSDQRRKILPIKNPLTEDHAVMRTSLAPGVFSVAAHNIKQQNKDLSLFEIGKTFIVQKGQDLPMETDMLTMVLSGASRARTWHGKGASVDFFDLKGFCEVILTGLHIKNAIFKKNDPALSPFIAPNMGAAIKVNGNSIGILGQVRSDVLKKFDVKQAVFVAEFDVLALFAAMPEQLTYEPPPRFPATDRDITLIIDKNVEAGAVQGHVQDLEHKWVESMEVVAMYEGKPVPAGKKSLSFRIRYRSKQGTLQDREVNEVHEKISGELLSAFLATLPQG